MSKPVVLRSSGGQSILKELSNELVAVEVEDAVAAQCFGHGGSGVYRRRARASIDRQSP
jgi:hypothetical protein